MNRQHRVRRLQTQLDKPMREVALVSMKRTAALTQSDKNHRAKVIQRNRHHADRCEQDMPASGAFVERARHCQCCQQESNQITAAVTHEDAGWRPVPDKEPGQ